MDPEYSDATIDSSAIDYFALEIPYQKCSFLSFNHQWRNEGMHFLTDYDVFQATTYTIGNKNQANG